MVSARQIQEQLAAWLADRISLREFEDWFVPATWEVHKWNDSKLESLVDEIELNLSEYTDRAIDIRELKTRFLELANANRPFVQVEIPVGKPPYTIALTSRPLRMHVEA